MVKRLPLLVLMILPFYALAQNDSIKLVCPLNDATLVPPPKNAIKFDPPDLCISLTSRPDTMVKACIDGRVTNVEQNEEGGWDVVFFYIDRRTKKEYYFWYAGMKRVIVKRNDFLKAGQPIGVIEPGNKVELLMYQFETQLDPTKYLDCKNVLKTQ
jgi:hypothetical protein